MVLERNNTTAFKKYVVYIILSIITVHMLKQKVQYIKYIIYLPFSQTKTIFTPYDLHLSVERTHPDFLVDKWKLKGLLTCNIFISNLGRE